MESTQRPGIRFWIETALAVASGAILAVTLITRTWIEALFNVDPDRSNGSLEWIIVGAALVVTVASVTLASREWRRLRVSPAPERQ